MQESRLIKIGLQLSFWELLLFICFYLTRSSVNSFDTYAHYLQSKWLLSSLGLLPFDPIVQVPDEGIRSYGPLWEFILGTFTEYFFYFLREPGWVRNAITLFSFPISLYILYRMLCKSGTPASTAIFVLSLLFGMIRLGGHALINSKDYPLAMSYLLVTVYQYIWIIREGHRPSKKPFTFSSLFTLGSVSIIPFLVRPVVAPV